MIDDKCQPIRKLRGEITLIFFCLFLNPFQAWLGWQIFRYLVYWYRNEIFQGWVVFVSYFLMRINPLAYCKDTSLYHYCMCSEVWSASTNKLIHNSQDFIFNIKNIIMQERLWGSLLCTASMDKMRQLLDQNEVLITNTK